MQKKVLATSGNGNPVLTSQQAIRQYLASTLLYWSIAKKKGNHYRSEALEKVADRIYSCNKIDPVHISIESDEHRVILVLSCDTVRISLPEHHSILHRLALERFSAMTFAPEATKDDVHALISWIWHENDTFPYEAIAVERHPVAIVNEGIPVNGRAYPEDRRDLRRWIRNIGGIEDAFRLFHDHGARFDTQELILFLHELARGFQRIRTAKGEDIAKALLRSFEQDLDRCLAMLQRAVHTIRKKRQLENIRESVAALDLTQRIMLPTLTKKLMSRTEQREHELEHMEEST